MSNPTFQPNWASPLGETATRLMEKADIDALDLAERLEITVRETRALLSGVTPLREEAAHTLSEVLGGSPVYWLNRDRFFRDSVSRIPVERRYDPYWLASFPIGDMSRLGWIDASSNDIDRAARLLEFFGLSHASQWKFQYPEASVASAFRTSYAFDTQHEAVASWLRQGERLGQRVDCASWNRSRFRSRLREARALTRKRDPMQFFPELKRLCAECGVALVAVPTPSGCPASGATQFLTRSKALLMVSFRFKTDDQFWFSFFHEAGHLILHDIDTVFIDDRLEDGDSKEEREANSFAQSMLVPEDQREEMLNLPPRHKDVLRFAMHIGIAPGIVVGQMQKAGVLPYNYLNRLKRRYEDEVIGELFSL